MKTIHGRAREVSLFPNSRAIVVGLPQSFNLLSELASADTIRLGTAFAHRSGWEILAPAIAASKAKISLLTGTSFFQTEPKILREWLRISQPNRVETALHIENGITFHPKVLIVEGKKRFAIVGSGNLSRGGLLDNIECGLFVESRAILRELLRWFDDIFRKAMPLSETLLLNYERQWNRLRKRVKDIGHEQHRLQDEFIDEAVAYWALKTTSSSSGKDYWQMFCKEKVIAIGWEELPSDPANLTHSQLRHQLKRQYYPNDSKTSVDRAAATIKTFTKNLKEGDVVLVCHGYNSTQNKLVHICGIAKVTGQFRAETPIKKGYWRFKRSADIQPIDRKLPRDMVASALGKQTLLKTLHSLNKDNFNQLTKKLRVRVKGLGSLPA